MQTGPSLLGDLPSLQQEKEEKKKKAAGRALRADEHLLYNLNTHVYT